MSEAEVRRDEARAYAKGYAAGRRKRREDINKLQWEREQRAFLDKAFLAALPHCLEVDRPISTDRTLTERVELAWNVARLALQRRDYHN